MAIVFWCNAPVFTQVTNESKTKNTPKKASNADFDAEAKNTIAVTPDKPEVLKEQERIHKTLQYGTDTAVVKEIKNLTTLAAPDFFDDVISRMELSANEDVIVQGFTYLRDIKNKSALDFAFNLVDKDFDKQPQKAVQFALFYLKDFIDDLTEEEKKQLLNRIADIVYDDTPALALPALKLASQYYSEIDVPYEISTENENATDTFDNDEKINNPDDAKRFSERITEAYEDIATEVIKDEIIITLGAIHAYNSLDFIMDAARSLRESHSRRASAIAALGEFDLSGDVFKQLRKERFEVFDAARTDKVAKIRAALLGSLRKTTSAQSVVIESKNGEATLNEVISQWMMDGLRDDGAMVRKAVLSNIAAQVDNDSLSENSRDKFYDAVLFMSDNDTSNEVRVAALETLSRFAQGKEKILAHVPNIKIVNSVEKKYLELALKKYVESGGMEAVKKLVDDNLSKAVENNFFSDSLALMQKVSAVVANQKNPVTVSIVAQMLKHPDTTIKKNMLAAIARNKFEQFLPAVQSMANDINLPGDIRIQARKTAEIVVMKNEGIDEEK